MFQNDKTSVGLVPGSAVEAPIVNADDGMKVPSVAQLLDVSSDSGGQNELTVTSEMSATRPTIGDADRSNVLSPKPPEQSAVNQSTVESGASGLSSQESTVTRTRSRDVMDFAHLKMKLVQLTGPSKDAAGPSTAAAKTKPDAEEMKDTSVEVAATNSTSQLGAGRPAVGPQVVSGNQAVDLQPVAHRGPSLSPEPGTAPTQAASQQASMPELPATSTMQRDGSVQPVVPSPAVGQTKAVPSNGEHAAAPVQPIKPVPVYPVSVDQSLPQGQKLAGGQTNGSNAFQHIPASMLAPDIQSAMLLQQYQMSSAMPAVVDGTSGFAPVQPGDMVTTSCPASPDGINQVIGPQQPAAADYSPVSLLSLYNQMMMPLPLMAPAWPALGLNPYLVAANPLLAAQLMYGAPVMPPVSEPVGQMPAADPHLGMQSYPVAGQELQQPVMPSGLGLGLDQAQRDQAVRPMTGLAPIASGGMTSVMQPTRPVVPRLPAAHDQQPAMHATTVPRKRPDRPPHLANLEQALSRLHGPRKPAAPIIPVHSPAVHSLPGSMAWFPMPYGQQTQPTYALAAVQSPVVSPPLLSTDLQQPGTTTFNLAADMTTSLGASTAVPGTSLAVTSTYSGRSTPSVATTAESLPVTGKSVTAVTVSSANVRSEPAETVHATASAAEKVALASTSSAEQMPSKRKLQFTVSAVKDDPLTASNLQESATVCEASTVNSEPASRNPPQNVTSTQNHVSVPSGLQEPVAGSTGKAPVKKGRFRISDVKEDVDGGVSSSQLEGSSLTHETSLASSSVTDQSNQCVSTAVLTALDQQVCTVYKCFYLQLCCGQHMGHTE